MVKNPPASPGDPRDMGWSLGQKDPLEEEMVVHSCSLAWKIPWTEEPGGLQFLWEVSFCVTLIAYSLEIHSDSFWY